MIENPEGNKPLGRPGMWEGDIKMDLKGMDWIHLTQDIDEWGALVIMVINLQVT